MPMLCVMVLPNTSSTLSPSALLKPEVKDAILHIPAEQIKMATSRQTARHEEERVHMIALMKQR
jgi:hypothetical protein